MKNHRLDFPSTTRNAEPILQALRDVLPKSPCEILEIASGSGQHAVHFCTALSQVNWWPSDLDPTHIASINAWRDHADLHNRINPAQIIDVCDSHWKTGTALEFGPALFDAMLVVNMIHIAPWKATLGLMEGAAHRLKNGGALVLYGPYKKDGKHTAPSNLAFDESLRARNPDWGVRDMEEVINCAQKQGLAFCRRLAMPANNFCLIFKKQ